mgnify:FL=1
MRLDKLLARRAGLSRSQAKDAIKAGRLLVDGKIISRVDEQVEEHSALTLDGQSLRAAGGMHLMLNKPAGLLTAARDAKAATIFDLLPELARTLKCMPVGRLDKETEGLLLLTTEGELAHRLLAPRRGIGKLYLARVEGRLREADITAFQEGIRLSDFTALPAGLNILEADEQVSLAQVELTEGKHRQVRRMFGSLGHPVLTLKRLRFGPLTLDDNLAPGAWRELTAEELQALKEAVGLV